MAVRREMRALLCLLLKAVSFLGLVFVCFGVNYVPTLLAVLPGAKWATPEVSKAAAGSFIHSFIHSTNGKETIELESIKADVAAVACSRTAAFGTLRLINCLID